MELFYCLAEKQEPKSRVIPMSKKVQNELAQLVTETGEYFEGLGTAVFVNSFGEPMKYDHMRKE